MDRRRPGRARLLAPRADAGAGGLRRLRRVLGWVRLDWDADHDPGAHHEVRHRTDNDGRTIHYRDSRPGHHLTPAGLAGAATPRRPGGGGRGGTAAAAGARLLARPRREGLRATLRAGRLRHPKGRRPGTRRGPGTRTRHSLEEGRRPRARSRVGRVVEVDERRQLLLVVDDGRVRWTFNTSTGTDEHYTYGGRRYLADTPYGRWKITGGSTAGASRIWDGCTSPSTSTAKACLARLRQRAAVCRLPRLRPLDPGRDRLSLGRGRRPIGTPVWVY